MTMRTVKGGALAIGAIAAMVFSAACDDAGTDGGAVIEVVGSWRSDFGDEVITKARWDGYCQQAIARFDNDDNVAALQALSGEGCGAGYSRVVWLEPEGDSFYYCVTAFGAETADMVWSAPEIGIDRGAVDTTGCAGFAWSKLTRR